MEKNDGEGKMNVKIPWTFTAVVALILIWVVYTAAVWSGIIDAGNDAAVLAAFITGWIGVLVFAILGAFLLGMYSGHRILSLGDFTPFEEEMLHMKEDVAQMRAELKTLRKEKQEADDRNAPK
jgi:fumarate reductase subunit D